MGMSDRDIANAVLRGNKPAQQDSGQPDTAADDAFFSIALELQEVLIKLKDLDVKKKALTETLLVAQDTGAFSVESVSGIINYGERTGGFKDELVPLLKEKGLRDAIKVKETADNEAVEGHVGTGDLSEDEVAEYRKPKSRFYQLPRGKG